MPKPQSPLPSPASQPPDNPAGCLVRIFWMAIGGLALMFLAAAIFRRGAFSILDVVYWLVVAATAGARFIDVTRFQGRTASGEPATVAHVRRYALVLFVVAVAAWVGAHGLRVLTQR